VLAVGNLAFGWWAVGCAAVGMKCAVGFAALACDYAAGIAATVTEASTAAAKEWVRTQWRDSAPGTLVDSVVSGDRAGLAWAVRPATP
jgi:hypothetical protein